MKKFLLVNLITVFEFSASTQKKHWKYQKKKLHFLIWVLLWELPHWDLALKLPPQYTKISHYKEVLTSWDILPVRSRSISMMTIEVV